MENFLEILNMWHWLGLGIVLIMLDILLGTSFFLLWQGVCAGVIATILAIFPSVGWKSQLTLFTILSVGSLCFWKVYLKKYPTQTDKPRLNRRNEQYIGRVFTLEEDIVNGRGKVRVDDSTWRIDGPDLSKGTKITVTRVSGTLLHVEELKSE